MRFVVMAAGKASRMGKDKLALPWKESTVLSSVLEVILKVQEELKGEVVVVTRQAITTYLKENQILEFKRQGGVWIEVESPQPLSETIRRGLTGIGEEIKGICFVPGDQVGLEPQVLLKLSQTFLTKAPDFLIPVTQKATRSPVFFHHRFLEELRSLRGEEGGKTILYRYPESWTTYQVNPVFFEDIDTPEDYERLRGV